MKRFAIIGTALSGNKGAAGMALALVQNFSSLYPDAQFTILSYFPKSDHHLNHYPNVEIVSATPLTLLCCFPLAAIAFFLRILNFPIGPLRRIPTLRAIADCDLYLEAAGVSFVDGREKFLPLNILWILLPLAFGKRIVKVSQALGPFKNPLNRALANLLLPHVDLICARGSKTAAHLDSLGLTNFAIYPDVAFSLNLDDLRKDIINQHIPLSRGKALIGVSPSQVVYSKCLRQGIDYIRLMAAFIERLISEGYTVVIIPHSARQGTRKTRNNDLPVCKQIFDHLLHPISVHFVEEELTPSELRTLIGNLDFLVASRFHAMISALAMQVPVLVFGWSHKYIEVLEAFGLESAAFDYKDMNLEKIYHLFEKQFRDRNATRMRIQAQLDSILLSATRFFLKTDILQNHDKN